MQLFANEASRKVRGCHMLEITCAHCKCFIAKYQKVGTSGLVKMYHDRILSSSMDISTVPGAIYCPSCGERIATKYTTHVEKEPAYRLVPSAFNKKRVRQ